jgi:hypothetical protein
MNSCAHREDGAPTEPPQKIRSGEPFVHFDPSGAFAVPRQRLAEKVFQNSAPSSALRNITPTLLLNNHKVFALALRIVPLFHHLII